MDPILSFEYGSRAMGLGTVDSDHDIMRIVIEPPEYVTGLEEFETIQESTAEKNQRSAAGDTDITTYGLKHWAKLAAKGNPTVLTALFVPDYAIKTELGQRLLDNRGLFISKEAGRRYRGYSWGQRMAMLGTKNKRTNRPELIHKHGFDTKFAYHMVRTAYQGIELMNSGSIQLPIEPEMRERFRNIRDGKWTKDEVLDWGNALDQVLAIAIETSGLPDKADKDAVSYLLHDMYLEDWGHADYRCG